MGPEGRGVEGKGVDVAAPETMLRQGRWVAEEEKGGRPSDGELASFQIMDTSGTIGRIISACTNTQTNTGCRNLAYHLHPHSSQSKLVYHTLRPTLASKI